MGQELERIGYAGPDDVGGRPVHAFFEVHIEQGPILEEEGLPIGVQIVGRYGDDTQTLYWAEWVRRALAEEI